MSSAADADKDKEEDVSQHIHMHRLTAGDNQFLELGPTDRSGDRRQKWKDVLQPVYNGV